MNAQGVSSLASLDGDIMPAAEAMIPATDDGLIRGDGVFEVVRVYDGRPFAFEQHLARLERSADNLRLAVDVEAVRADGHRLLAHAGPGPDHDLLRIVLTRGGGSSPFPLISRHAYRSRMVPTCLRNIPRTGSLPQSRSRGTRPFS